MFEKSKSALLVKNQANIYILDIKKTTIIKLDPHIAVRSCKTNTIFYSLHLLIIFFKN